MSRSGQDQRKRGPSALFTGVAGALAAVAVAAVALTVPALSVVAGPAFLIALAAAAAAFVSAAREAYDPDPRPPRAEAVAASPVEPDPVPFREVLEALDDPVLVVESALRGDPVSRRIVFANAAARALFRTPEAGAPLVAAIRDPEVLEAVDAALFEGLDRRTRRQAPGAQERSWTVTTRPLERSSNGVARALVTLQDDTDALKVAALRADFLANASHELRTPLASLSGFIETLRGHARDDAEARDKFLDIMAAQAERMRRLIADLLSLSRIELNEHVPPSGVVDLALVVGDVADALSPMCRERNVKVKAIVPPAGEALIRGDRDQIVQVVQNLADNALKYSPDGSEIELEVRGPGEGETRPGPGRELGARLTLLSPDRDERARYLTVSARDKGPGIARVNLPRLTERFYRVEGQKSGDRSGTGLGLAIVKHVVNRHRGGISVDSVPGEGSIFSVWLPVAEGVAGEVEAIPDRNKTVMETS